MLNKQHVRQKPSELASIARYFGVQDLPAEPDLEGLMMQAFDVPLPPDWSEGTSRAGKVVFTHKSKLASERHPMDYYFYQAIERKRSERSSTSSVLADPDVVNKLVRRCCHEWLSLCSLIFIRDIIN